MSRSGVVFVGAVVPVGSLTVVVLTAVLEGFSAIVLALRQLFAGVANSFLQFLFQ